MMDGIDWPEVCNWFNSFRFVFTVLIATWIFTRGSAPKRGRYGLRVALVVAAGIILAVSNPLYVGTDNPLPWLSVSNFVRVWIVVTFLLALLSIKFLRRTSWTNALSRWAMGLCVERFITSFIHNWLFLIIIKDFKTERPLSYIAISLFIYGLFLMMSAHWLAPLFARDLTPLKNDGGKESRTLCMLYILGVVALYLVTNASMGISEQYVDLLRKLIGGDAEGRTLLDYILYFSTGMAGLVALLIFLFQYAIYHTTELRHESALLQVLSEQKSRQFDTISANIDYINHKSHDLKHQIDALEYAEGSRRGALVREVRNALNLYDSTANTGNDALDTLITERNFFCARNGIRMTCSLAGCDWDAIDVVDLYTILGNALDNACDYVMRFDNPDKRVISVSARQKGNLIVLSIDNYFEETLDMADGLPKTTKPDTFSHGLGLKSIRNIAHRYGGDILVTAKPPIFTLQISLFTDVVRERTDKPKVS